VRRVIWYLVLTMLVVVVVLMIVARGRPTAPGPVAGSWRELTQWF
jgi:hypothetical protein